MANLKVREVAERLDVSSKTVYTWLRGGVIQGTKVGNTWRVSEETLGELLAPSASATAVAERPSDAGMASAVPDVDAGSETESDIARIGTVTRATRSDGRINVALIGVGNCASALVQGIHKYSEVDDASAQVPGLMHNVLGGYSIGDVNIVAAFDVDKKKVGRDVSEAGRRLSL